MRRSLHSAGRLSAAIAYAQPIAPNAAVRRRLHGLPTSAAAMRSTSISIKRLSSAYSSIYMHITRVYITICMLFIV